MPENLTKMDESIKLLTYNVGLLDFRIFGYFTVFSNPPHSVKRLPFIADAIRSRNADIVVLQEIYDEIHVNLITQKLRDMYPFISRQASGGILQFHNGLVILSKWPVTDQRLVRCDDAANLELLLASKSFLASTIDIPSVGRICVVNVHLTAGGEQDPTSRSSEDCREKELRQVIDFINYEENNGKPCILLGDFNCGPEASAINYEYVIKNGFRDTFLEAVHRSEQACTWHPDNILNKCGPHSRSPPQRIDHIMISQLDFWKPWEVAEATITFNAEVVPIDSSTKSTISDHYGLEVTIARTMNNSNDK